MSNVISLHDYKKRSPKRPILIGYSWGGYVTLREALNNHRNVRGIILISPHLCSGEKMNSIGTSKPMLDKTMFLASGPKLMEDVINGTSTLSPKGFNQLKGFEAPSKLSAEVASKGINYTPLEMLVIIGGLNIPVCLIRGENDTFSDYEKQIKPVKENLNIVSELVINNAGHEVPWTHSETVSSFIKNFQKQLNEDESIDLHSF